MKKNEQPKSETREQRIARVRKLAADKDTRPNYWPGKASERKAGDELVGVLVDVRDVQHRKYKSTEMETVKVASVRTGDGKLQLVQLNGGMDRQVTELGAEIGDELLFLYRGKREQYNDFAIELLSKAAELSS